MIRRIFNWSLAGLLFVALLPIMAMVATMVVLVLGRPMVFRQWRLGRNGQPFEVWKFRTMAEKRDCRGELLPDAERDTKFGRWLRKTSLDELPQLWNVLRGDMNLVGPRPLMLEHWEQYTEFERRRHEVRPGITGWAQINGRNSISWQEKFRLDVWYVDHRSLWLDIKIMFITFLRVVRAQGINHSDEGARAERERTSLGLAQLKLSDQDASRFKEAA